MKRFLAYLSICLLVAPLFGCAKEEETIEPAPTAEGAEPVVEEPAAQEGEPTAQEATATQTPAGQMPSAVANGGPFSGTVVETMDSGGYTYLLMDVDGGQYWVAAQRLAAAVGDSIEVRSGVLMRGFHSSTLDRTFDTIVFASDAGTAGGAQPADGAEPLPEGHPAVLPEGHPPI